MSQLKRYKIRAKNVEHLLTSYIEAVNIYDAKKKFHYHFTLGDIAIINSELVFQEVKRKEIKHAKSC